MIAAILVIVLVGGLFVGFSVFGIKKIRAITDDSDDTSSDPKVSTAQDFLPFKDIKDGVIEMGGHEYVGIIEVTSTNYFLRTEEEQNRIEASFTRFLNSLSQRIVIFTQTKEMDYSRFLKGIEKNMEILKDTNPQLVNMSQSYYNEMLDLPSRTGTSKQKKKYILVPYNGAIELKRLDDKEKRDYSIQELRNRMSIISSGLPPVGVKGTPLNTKEVVDLIHSTFLRDTSSSEDIFNGKHLTLFMDGENLLNDISDEDLVDLILYEAQERLKLELSQRALNEDGYGEFINKLNDLRDLLGFNNQGLNDEERGDINEHIK